MIIHPIKPIYNNDSKILILGSFPSVKSREEGFFYGNEKNRFWKVISSVFGSDLPNTIDEKTQFLLDNKIALWDVIHSCDINGSSDSTIKNVKANDIAFILNNSNITKIFTNGKKAYELYEKYIMESTKTPAIYLPSTSPANASWSEERLVQYWKGAIFE